MVRKLIIFIFLSFFLFKIFGESFLDKYKEESEEIILTVGEATTLKVPYPQRVSINNPNVVDIPEVLENEIVIVAKGVGETAINIWTKEGKKTFYVVVYSHDLDRTKAKLEKLIREELNIKNVKVKKNETLGKVMLLGEVEVSEKELIDKALEMFFEKETRERKMPLEDKVENLLKVKKESKMVEIEARILEINKTKLDQLGVKWMEKLQIRQEPYKAEATTELGASKDMVATTLDIQAPWTALWGMGLWSRDALHARIDLLIRRGDAKELSRPKLLCLSKEEAKLIVGGEVPYVSGATTATAGTTMSIEYREYGVIFKFKPEVLSDNKIFLNLGTEVSELDWANGIVVSGINIPAFAKRRADTVLNISSGETIFIAGLIKNKDSLNIDKFPALGDVPILGALFKSKEFRGGETELVITLTPTIVESKSLAELEVVKEVEIDKDKKRPIFGKGEVSEELQDYILKVQRKIFNNISYPPSLLNTGWEGVVVLKLTIERNGDLKNVEVIKSSGYKIFDDEAIKLVRSLSFPNFPPALQIEELQIEVPITYRGKSN